MTSFATILRRIALVLTAFLALGGSLFALGYAWADLPVWAALLLTLAVAIPMVGLAVLARRSPDLAARVLAVLVGLFAVYAVLGIFTRFVEAPDLPVIALVLALPIAVLGQRQPLRAGLLLLALAAFPLIQLVFTRLGERDGPGFGALFGGSTGVVIIPLTILAILFLAAAGGDHDRAAGARPTAPPREALHT